MAQLPGSSRVNQYTASALQTTFIYDFRIKADDEIIVQQNSTTLTLTTDYTVTDAGEEAGGTIVLVTGATLNDIITLTGNSMVERETTFSNGGDFAAAAINGEYNNILDMVSENVTEIDKTVRLRVYDASFDATIPTPIASKAVKINATGDGFEMSTYDPDLAVTEAGVYAAEAAASASDALVAETAAETAETNAETAETNAETAAANAQAYAESINLTALASNITPDADSTRWIGTSGTRFARVYADYIWATNATYSGSVSATGNLSVNTDKFTVDATNGNTAIAGTLTVGGVPVGGMGKAALYTYSVLYNVDGGGYSTAQTWQIRPLNTEVFDTIGTSLSSNKVLIPAGTYTVWAGLSHSQCSFVRHRIYDYTNSVVLAEGPQVNDNASVYQSYVSGAFTIPSPVEIEIQMIGATSKSVDGMGVKSNYPTMGNNIYAQLLITKIS